MESQSLESYPFYIDYSALADSIPAGIGGVLLQALGSFYFWFQIVSMFLSLFLLIGIIFSLMRVNQIRKVEKQIMEQAAAGTVLPPTGNTLNVGRANERWEHVKELMKSESENDWRLAILEADIILDDMVERMHYPGETLGERLRVIEKSDFNTIDDAWEAHKVRNQIAHEGSGLNLSRREARRVISLYERVFKEFHYI